MINFRFHLVSLVAVFLALAVGIVMGYGVLGQPTVEGLQNRIDTVEARADTIRIENDQLRAEVERQEAALSQLGHFAVTDRLTEANVVVLAVRGVSEEAVTEAVALARRAGAEAPGIIWLEPRWTLRTEEDRDALVDVLGTTVTRRSALRERGWRALTGRLVNGPGFGTDLLQALTDTGFIAYEGVDEQGEVALEDLGSPDTLALLALGTGARMSPDAAESFARAAVDATLSLVVAEVHRVEDGAPGRGSALAAIREGDGVSAEVSTVDNLDRPSGPITAVLALSDLRQGVVGHYGSGEGATAVAPAWSES